MKTLKNKKDIIFLTELDKLYVKNNIDECVKMIYSHFGSLVIKQKYKRCNLILISVNNKNYKPNIIMPFLTLTLHKNVKVPNRNELFLNLINQYIDTQSKEELKSTFNRLYKNDK